jgi:hypothetical protein
MLQLRKFGLWLAVLGILPVSATTLQKLSLPELAQQSTAVVRARVVGAVGILRGSDVYTVYKLEPLEVWKSAPAGVPTEVAVPGGVAGGLRQPVDGAPSLLQGHEYVLFLWAAQANGKAQLTQLTGLSQGVFDVRNVAGAAQVFRAAAGERMLDAQGHPAADETVAMKLADFKRQVSRALAPQMAKGEVR